VSLQEAQQVIPAVGRVAQFERPDGFGRQPALGEVLLGMRRAAQALAVKKVRRVDEFAQAVALIGRLLGERLLAQFNPRAFCQAAHRLAERQPLDAHQKGQTHRPTRRTRSSGIGSARG
jgi:hypothetical protein